MWAELYGHVLPTLEPMRSDASRTNPDLRTAASMWAFRSDCYRFPINGMLFGDRALLAQRNRSRYEIAPYVPQWQFAPLTLYTRSDEDCIRYIKKNQPEYGPSLQWFVREAERKELNESQLCQSIVDWALRPLPQENRYHVWLKQQSAPTHPDSLDSYFATPVIWRSSGNLEYPWESLVDGKTWRLRLNDFPEEMLYTLVDGQRKVGDFNCFPKVWKRPKQSLPTDESDSGTWISGQHDKWPETLRRASGTYRETLNVVSREQAPLQWAASQFNLGSTLLALGEQESETETLRAAAVACREALKEWTHDRSPLQWAIVQCSLSIALSRIGERENGTEYLQQSVDAFHELLELCPPVKLPCAVENTLGELDRAQRLLEIRRA